MKKVLIIAYYWPPAGGGGVQRWLKFAKYLPEFGWEPILYVPANADYPDVDESLVADSEGIRVIRQPIWEPYQLYRRFLGQSTKDASKKPEKVNPGFFEENPPLSKRIAIWVRGNLFIPDARRFWVRPSVRFLRNFLRTEPVDVIITTGTPHSLHLIGLGLRRATGIPWIADFRDPWTTIEFYHKLRLSRWADHRHHVLEKRVLTTADHVTSASWAWADDYRALGARAVTTITNGYDEADFVGTMPPRENRFVLCHAGTLAEDRNPIPLWEALQDLCDEEEGFRDDLVVRFAGKTDIGIIRSLVAHSLGDNGEDYGYVPHAEAITLMQSAGMLLLLINQVGENAQGRIAGKVFEYLASGTPILCIAPPDGDSARIIRETGAGHVCAFGDKRAMKTAVLAAYRQWQLQRATAHTNVTLAEPVRQYTRRALTQRLAAVLDGIGEK